MWQKKPILNEETELKGRDTIKYKYVLKYDVTRQAERVSEEPGHFINTDKEYKISGWKHYEGQINGYVIVEPTETDRMLEEVQELPFFLEKITEEYQEKPPIRWVRKRINEEDGDYWRRAKSEATEANKPLIWRKGGGSDLGVKGLEPEQSEYTKYVVKGLPERIGQRWCMKSCNGRATKK